MPYRNPIDAHVGAQLAKVRRMAGMTVAELARAIDVPEAGLVAMEDGRRRVGAALLQRLCEVLDVPVSRFFEGMTMEGDDRLPELRSLASEGVELQRAFVKIADPEQRRLLVVLARAMAGHTHRTDPLKH